MSIPGGNPHILVYPFTSSGHTIPFIDLTHRLLNRGLSITFAVTTNNLPLLNPFHSSPHFHPLTLPSIDVPADCKNHLIAMIRFLRDHHSPLLLDFFRSHSDPPIAIISDFFLGWTHELASKVGIPRFVFSPYATVSFSLISATWRHEFTQTDPDPNSNPVVKFVTVPNSPTYPYWQLNHVYRAPRDADWEFFRYIQMSNMAGSGLIVNSFAHIESVYLDHLKKDFGNDNVWAVGPALPADDDVTGCINRGGSSSVAISDLKAWLDSRKPDSVVYICFGSWMWLTSKQMKALTTALENSSVSFILCDRQPSGVTDAGVLPEGFKDSVGERGFIIKGWAPQLETLKHPAVGAFLNTCGWNSSLEAISAGVVMLAWPMGIDHYTNTKLLVDQLGVGIRVGVVEAPEMVPDSGELARILDESVGENLRERKNVKILQQAALNAIKKGGSSDQDLDGFVAKLNQLKLKI